MPADEPISCGTCQGVTAVETGESYTPARARLILENGFCLCERPETPDD
ncbi:hypothetical protein ACIBHX_28320 [Nonomuraea sp. NPDC050536]